MNTSKINIKFLRVFVSANATVALVTLLTSPAVFAQTSPTFVTYDIPGLSCPAYDQCLTPVAIDAFGDVTGYYNDSNFAAHGYLRRNDGTVVKFDAPGAQCNFYFGQCALPTGINFERSITGYYSDSTGAVHGFLRSFAGTYQTFDPPGSNGTTPGGINDLGAVTGGFTDANFTSHGFIRNAKGVITTFDGPSASGTFFNPPAINLLSTTTGTYSDSSSEFHGLIRFANGKFISFDFPNAAQTFAVGINLEGSVIGYYDSPPFVPYQAFLRNPDGNITSIAPPNSHASFPVGINVLCSVAGYFTIPRISNMASCVMYMEITQQ